jgi:hypothetical protein
MNSSSLTGILMVIVAIVSVGVIIPSLSKRGTEDVRSFEERFQRTQQIKQLRERTEKPTKMVSIARMSLRLSQLRMIFGFTLVGGVITALVALADAATLWPVSLAGLGVAVVSVLVTRTATRRHTALLAASLANRTRVAQTTSLRPSMDVSPTVVEAQDEAAGWTPVELPKPLHAGHIGNLEQPTLAQVKPLPVAQEQATTLDIDEILRKRRNVG